MKKLVLIATALAATTVAASAGSINRAQDRQYDRIEQGRKSGSITWTEGLKLRAEQNRIKSKEAQFRSDGYLSRGERGELRSMQRQASKNIANEKYDGKARPSWLPRVGK
jgi:uncharacterized protein HemX